MGFGRERNQDKTLLVSVKLILLLLVLIESPKETHKAVWPRVGHGKAKPRPYGLGNGPCGRHLTSFLLVFWETKRGLNSLSTFCLVLKVYFVKNFDSYVDEINQHQNTTLN